MEGSTGAARSVAALYDVHGNLPALEAVLAELERLRPDVVVVGGDVAAGPCPAESLELLRALRPAPLFVRGNCDRELRDGEEPHDRLTAWAQQRLGREERYFLADAPERVRLQVAGLGACVFCHGSPRSDGEFLTAATPPERLRDALAGVEEPVVVCGHSHHQFVHELDGRRVVNAGSVGNPYAERPGAYWLLLGPSVEHRRTEYDLAAAAARIRASGLPSAEEFVRQLEAPEDPREAAARLEREG